MNYKLCELSKTSIKSYPNYEQSTYIIQMASKRGMQ